MNLSNGIKVSVVAAAATAAQTEVVSDVLDMQGWGGVIFIALMGDVSDTSVLTLTAKGNTANHTSTPTPVAQGAATFTAGATNADSKVLMVDVREPVMRYCFASLTRTTANAIVGGIIAIQYRADLAPTAQHATVIASAVAAGTLA